MPHADGSTRQNNQALDQRQWTMDIQREPTSAIFGSYLIHKILRFAQVPIGAAGLENLPSLLGTPLGQQLVASR